MKRDRSHGVRLIIFSILAICIALACYFLFFRQRSLAVDFTPEYSLSFSGLSKLGLIIILLFDAQILLYETVFGWKRRKTKR